MVEAASIGRPADAGPADLDAALDALRQRGGERLDPVRFRFLAGLAERLPAQPVAVRQALDEKLGRLLRECDERLTQAKSDAHAATLAWSQRFPAAAEELHGLCAAGEFDALRRLGRQLEKPAGGGALAGLVRELAQTAPESELALAQESGGRAAQVGETAIEMNGGGSDELKAVRYFRDTWSMLSTDQQLSQALTLAPENAGPLNSHRLVLQSLKRLQLLSPEYLNRLMAYVDALLWLDQAGGSSPIRKTVAGSDSEKKRKPAGAKTIKSKATRTRSAGAV